MKDKKVSQNQNVKLCVVIATKDRPEMLTKLLESIEESVIKPDLLSITSSGVEIRNVIKKFDKNIKIIHQHINNSGQVLQRKIALKNIDDVYDAYIFLDDDVTVAKDLFYQIGILIAKKDKKLGGIGLNLQDNVTDYKNNKATLNFRKKILPKFLAGKVLISGRNLPYNGLEKTKQVMWLNGLSIWTYPVISNFTHIQMGNKYAAAEDLIFSYEVGKTYQLYYIPELKVQDQRCEKKMIASLDIYRTSWQHKLYFVLTNSKLSFWMFILDNLISLLIILFSLIKGKFRSKIQIIYFNIKFLFRIFKNRSEFINNPNYQQLLLNKLI